MKWYIPPAAFAALLIIAWLPVLLGLPAQVSTVFAAPLYYAVPLGVGLLVTLPLGSAVTRTQRALFAYLCGLVLISVVMVVREHGVPAHTSVQAITALLVFAAVAGFALGHRLFRWDAAARTAGIDYLAVVPVFAIGYAVRFGVFSDYPVTDLFQATHLMKGALEFGRFDILNPFSAGSYVPAIQVMQGLLVRYLGFDPLVGAWVLPALASGVKFLACRAALQPFLQTRAALLFATAIAVGFFSGIAPTNGELALLGSLLVFALAARGASDARLASAAGVLTTGFVALALGYFATRSVPLLYLSALGATILLPLAATAFRVERGVLVFAPLVVALAPLHRSTLAFVPMALVLGALMPLACAWIARGPPSRARASAMVVAALTGFAAIGVGVLLGWVVLNPADELREVGPGGWLVETLLGATPTDPNILAGSGPKVALFELARAVVPSLALFAGALVVLAPVPRALVAWGFAVLLAVVLLIGVPFVYRAGFLIVTLLIIALAASWEALEQGGAMRRSCLGVLAAVYAVVAIPLAYRCGVLAACQRAEYLDLARPLLVGVGVLLLAGALTVLARVQARAALAFVLVLLLSLESQVSQAFFMPYGYGSRPPGNAAPVSHFSREELALAATARALGDRLVIASDPYTMSNLRALTGLNSLVTYSNLDTLSDPTERRLREWLRDIVEPANSVSGCAPDHPLALLDGSVNSAELNYWLARVAAPEVPGRVVLEEFGLRDTLLTTVHPSRKGEPDRYPDDAWRRPMVEKLERRFPGEPAVVLVIDSKTVRWARGEQDIEYFPDVRPLDPDLIRGLQARCGAEVHDGRFAVIRFPMARR